MGCNYRWTDAPRGKRPGHHPALQPWVPCHYSQESWETPARSHAFREDVVQSERPAVHLNRPKPHVLHLL